MGMNLRTWPKDPTKPPQIILAKSINERECTLQMKQFDFEFYNFKDMYIISSSISVLNWLKPCSNIQLLTYVEVDMECY